MLVLSRQCEQSIFIGDDIQIKVVAVRNGKIRLGIEAPRTVSVHRSEVFDAIADDRGESDAVPEAA